MKLIETTCPKCGAQLRVDRDRREAICEHCGNAFLIDDEVIRVRHENAEEAGYQFEKGRQRAQAEAQSRRQAPRKKRQATPLVRLAAAKAAKQSWIQRNWLWVLGWVFVFPIPLTLVLLKKQRLNPILKWAIIVIGWAVYLWIGLALGKNGNDAPTVMPIDAVQTIAPQFTEEPIASPTAEATAPADVPAEPVARTLEDFELDALQRLFLAASLNTTEEQVLRAVQANGLAYTRVKYNGRPKNVQYKIAFEKDIAIQSHAKEGDHLEISFSQEDGSVLNIEYFNHSSFMNALLFNYGIHWDYMEETPFNRYTGYYYSHPGQRDGIVLEYSNGRSSAPTSYHPCGNAEEALLNVLAPQ